ncbi:MAG: YceI family protein [Pseudomonadota bacterium]
MKQLLVALVLGTMVGAAGAAQQIQPAQSEIMFAMRQMGVPVEGRFKRFGAEVNFDPARPQAGRIQISIDTGSAGFGSPELDLEVPKGTWLDAVRFPKAVFRSSSIRQTGPDRFDILGKLSLKGVDRDVTVPVKIVQSAGSMVATGTFAIKRLDYKVGDGEWSDASMVANEVQVRFSLALTGSASP